MSDYKLVPVEPTQEMVEAARQHHEGEAYLPVSLYKAMLAAAPAVQGEPVAWQPVDELRFEYRHPKTGEAYTVSLSREEVMEMMDQELFEKLTACFCECEPIGETNVVDCRCDEYADQFELVTAPQPAEQQPPADGSLTPVPDELFAAEFNAWWEQHGQFCRAGGGDYERTFAFEAWRHLYPQLMNLQMAAAEQQPACASQSVKSDSQAALSAESERQAPDVAGLVEALEKARDAIGSLPQDALGNVPDTQQCQGWHIRDELINDISTALAAHRKQGGE